jgi:L-lactate dehydrogenase complex protein LldG
MVEQFTVAAEAVGASVKRFTSREGVAAALDEIVGDRPAVASPILEHFKSLIDTISFLPPDQSDRAYIGISAAQAAIAATGSLLLELGDPAERSATALPPVHVVLLRASTIVPDLSALGGALQQHLASPGPSYLSLITGPSRTADIERVLTIGVHGPKELHILILEGE